MKISRVVLYHLRMPLVSPFETSFGSISSRDCIFMELYADGLVGYGECAADRDPGYSYETSGTAWHMLKDFLIPEILNQDVQNVDELQKLFFPVRGHPMAKAGVELAFWDLLGNNRVDH